MNAGIAAPLAELLADTPPALLGLVDLLLKATLLLAVGFVLDFLLRKRRPLAAVTLWNTLLAAIVVLPAAHLLLPKAELLSGLDRLGAPPAGEASASDPLVAPLLDPTRNQSPSTAAPSSVAPPTVTAFEAPVPTLTLPATGYLPGVVSAPYSPRPGIAGFTHEPPAASPPFVSEEHASTPPSAPAAPPLETRTRETPAAAAIVSAPAGSLPAVWNRMPWLFVAAGVYLLGFLITACRLAVALRAVSQLRRTGEPLVDENWQRSFRRWARHLGLDPAKIELRTSDRVNVPLVVGLRRPMVIVPREIARSASSAVRDAVLVHELTHVARADYAWQILLRLIQTVLWFHPLVWFAQRRIHYVRERVCDAFSVHGLGSA